MTVGATKAWAGDEAPVVYYRYQDESGEVTVVDALERIPEKYRAGAQEVIVGVETQAQRVVRTLGEATKGAKPFVYGLDGPSALAGAGAMAMVFFALAFLRPMRRVVVKTGLLLLGAGLLGGAYFGWLDRASRPQAGRSDAFLGRGDGDGVASDRAYEKRFTRRGF